MVVCMSRYNRFRDSSVSFVCAESGQHKCPEILHDSPVLLVLKKTSRHDSTTAARTQPRDPPVRLESHHVTKLRFFLKKNTKVSHFFRERGPQRKARRRRAGFSFSFSGQIPVFTGNGIPFRNFGEFRRISVDFGRNLLNFEF